MLTDFKPQGRIRDTDLLRQLHLEWKECALCGSVGQSSGDSPNPENLRWYGLSLHHILKHPRDDLRGNLIMLCGHGTAGCHGKVEQHDEEALRKLGLYLTEYRGDVISHLYQRLGVEAAHEFLREQLLVDS